LQRRLDERTRERDEGEAQKAAMAENPGGHQRFAR
jgi:hypothetical protein